MFAESPGATGIDTASTPGTLVGNGGAVSGGNGDATAVGASGDLLSVHAAASIAIPARIHSFRIAGHRNAICPPRRFPLLWWFMLAIRRRVRAVTLAWLLCQVASLSAFVPGDCCIAHATEAAAKKKAAACHEAAAPVAPKEGEACPLHKGRTTHDCCAMTNACDGPGVQLLGLFAFVTTIEQPASSTTTLESTVTFVPPAPPLLSR